MDKTSTYHRFLYNLLDTNSANEYSKSDLENFEYSAQLHLEAGWEKRAALYKMMGPIFNALTDEQKKAFGDWNEYVYQQGIITCLNNLDSLRAESTIVLAYKNRDGTLESLNDFDTLKDFEKALKE
jgi:hypothetical protein